MYGGGGARVPLGSPAIFPGAPPRRAAAGGGGGETAVCAAGCTILCGCGGVLVKSVATSSMRRLQGGWAINDAGVVGDVPLCAADVFGRRPLIIPPLADNGLIVTESGVDGGGDGADAP